MSESDEHENELLGKLENDPFFSDWHETSRLLTAAAIDRAIGRVLDGHQGSADSPPGSHERAMRRLALFQVVAPFLSARPRTWIELMSLLGPGEVLEVEEILGDMSLGELLEEP